jgi:hypothetical protein
VEENEIKPEPLLPYISLWELLIPEAYYLYITYIDYR